MSPDTHTLTVIGVGARPDGSALAPVTTGVRLTDQGTEMGRDVARLLNGEGSVRTIAGDDAPTPEPKIEVALRRADEIEGTLIEGPWGTDTVPADMFAMTDRLLARLTRHQLDRAIGEGRLHAGAVVDSDGHAALLLGKSGAGKSTLTSHLVHSGFDLLNDEQITVYRHQGLVGGFTRPVAIKPGGHDQLPPALAAQPEPAQARLLTVTDLNADTRHRLTARPVVSVLLGRDHELADPGQAAAEPGAVRIEAVAPAEAFPILCTHSLDLVRKPADALADLAWMAATVPTVRLVYEEAHAAATAVTELLGAAPLSPQATWTVTELEADHDDVAGAAIVAVDGTVLVEIDQEAFVYEPLGRRLVALTGEALDLWHALPWCDEVPPALWGFIEPLEEAGIVRVTQPQAGATTGSSTGDGLAADGT